MFVSVIHKINVKKTMLTLAITADEGSLLQCNSFNERTHGVKTSQTIEQTALFIRMDQTGRTN